MEPGSLQVLGLLVRGGRGSSRQWAVLEFVGGWLQAPQMGLPTPLGTQPPHFVLGPQAWVGKGTTQTPPRESSPNLQRLGITGSGQRYEFP